MTDIFDQRKECRSYALRHLCKTCVETRLERAYPRKTIH